MRAEKPLPLRTRKAPLVAAYIGTLVIGAGLLWPAFHVANSKIARQDLVQAEAFVAAPRGVTVAEIR